MPYSKFTYHVANEVAHSGERKVEQFLREANPFVIEVFNNIGLAEAYQHVIDANELQTEVVHRQYQLPGGPNLDGDVLKKLVGLADDAPVNTANLEKVDYAVTLWFTGHEEALRRLPRAYHFTRNEGPVTALYAEWEKRLMLEADSRGVKLVIGSVPVGNPGNNEDDARGIWQRYYDIAGQYALQHGHKLTVNEYFAYLSALDTRYADGTRINVPKFEAGAWDISNYTPFPESDIAYGHLVGRYNILVDIMRADTQVTDAQRRNSIFISEGASVRPVDSIGGQWLNQAAAGRDIAGGLFGGLRQLWRENRADNHLPHIEAQYVNELARVLDAHIYNKPEVWGFAYFIIGHPGQEWATDQPPNEVFYDLTRAHVMAWQPENPEPEPEPEPSECRITITSSVTRGYRIREKPVTDFGVANVLKIAQPGDAFTVVGYTDEFEAENGRWYQVLRPDYPVEKGWVLYDMLYTDLTGVCSDLEEVRVSEPPDCDCDALRAEISRLEATITNLRQSELELKVERERLTEALTLIRNTASEVLA